MRGLSAASLTAMVLLFLGPHAAATEPSSRWVLIDLTVVDGSIEGMSYHLAVDIIQDGEGAPLVIGGGSANRDHPVRTAIHAVAGGSTRLRTTGNLGGLDYTLAQEDAPAIRWRTGGEGSGHRELGYTETIFLFVANGRLENLDLEAEAWSGPGRVDVQTTWGHRTSAILSTETHYMGSAATAASASVGSVRTAREIESGVVGAFNSLDCETCRFDWAAPDGRSASSARAQIGLGSYEFGADHFAGPAGAWTWSWTGLDSPGLAEVFFGPTASSVIAAYAELGDAWDRFKPGCGGRTAIGPVLVNGLGAIDNPLPCNDGDEPDSDSR